MTPFWRKKEPKEVFDEHMKKANELWKSPNLWKSSVYNKLLKHIEKAQEIAQTVEVDAGDVFRLWSMKGRVYFVGHHRYDKALECYDKALSLNPRDLKEFYDARLNRTSVLKMMGKWDEVIKDCDELVKLITQSSDKMIIPSQVSLLWVKKGEALVNLRRFIEALNCFDKSLELNPGNVDAWKLKAACYEILEKWGEAIDSYEKVIELGHELERVEAHGRRARAYLMIEKVLGEMQVYRSSFDDELLTFTQNRIIIITKDNRYLGEISCSDITKIELKKYGLGAQLQIVTNKKKHKWYIRPKGKGLFPSAAAELENYEDMLRPVFGGKLSVTK